MDYHKVPRIYSKIPNISWVRGACWLVPPVSLGLKCHLCVRLPVYHVLIMVIIRCFRPLGHVIFARD